MTLYSKTINEWNTFCHSPLLLIKNILNLFCLAFSNVFFYYLLQISHRAHHYLGAHTRLAPLWSVFLPLLTWYTLFVLYVCSYKIPKTDPIVYNKIFPFQVCDDLESAVGRRFRGPHSLTKTIYTLVWDNMPTPYGKRTLNQHTGDLFAVR